MKNTFPRHCSVLRATAVLLLSSFLLACGGGISLSGVGSGGSGIAEGSVSGFGSVIVNGVEYDDSNAVSTIESADRSTTVSAAKLGQRVRVSQSKDGVADTIEILPQLRGPVTSASSDGVYLQVMGQWVRVVSVSDTSGTATVVEAYDGIGSIAKDDSVEVHGVWTQDAARGIPVLVASRIEKLSGSFELLISGQVTSVGQSKFTLNDSGVVIDVGSSPPMPVGSQVTAWLSQWASASLTQQATRTKDAAPVPTGTQLLRLDVMAAASDVSGGQLRAQGRPIAIPENLQSQFPSTPAPLLLEATLQNGVWTATTLQLRNKAQDLGGEILLKGAIPWDATAKSLTLREAKVAIGSATVISANCPQSGPMVFLEVRAMRGPPGTTPVATSINCPSTVPGDSVIRQGGFVQSIAADGKSIAVLLDGQTTPLTMVVFDGSILPPPPLTLDALRRDHLHVDVEYQVVAGRNQLRSINPPPPQPAP